MGRGSDYVRAWLAAREGQTRSLTLSTPQRRDSEQGSLTLASVIHALRLALAVIYESVARRAAFYLPVSQWGAPLARDAILVCLMRGLGAREILLHLHGSQLPDRLLQSRLLRWAFRDVCWIVLSDRVGENLRAAVRVQDLHVVRNAAPEATPVHTNSLRQEQTDTSSTLRLGFLGAICSHKGADIVADLDGERLNNGTTRVIALLAGPIIDGNITVKNGHYIGFLRRDELARRFWSQIDVLALPARWKEGLPFVVLEALQWGVVVLASDSDGMAELVETGAVIPVPGERQGVLDALECIAAEGLVHARERQQQAWARVRDRYAEGTVRQELYSVLDGHLLALSG